MPVFLQAMPETWGLQRSLQQARGVRRAVGLRAWHSELSVLTFRVAEHGEV